MDVWVDYCIVLVGSVLFIIVDESCYVEVDVVCCVGYFDGINIKLIKCGGFILVCCMIVYVCLLGLKVMMGCMMESFVGILVIVYLVFMFDYVDMDGVFLLVKDLVEGVVIDNNVVFYFVFWLGIGVCLW